MRDLMIFLGSNAIAILVLTRKPSINNKYIYYITPIILIVSSFLDYYYVNVNIRMYNFDDVQCTVIPSVAYGFVTGMNLQLC